MRISVVTVCRNAERTIGDTIRSVRAQTHPDVEHIIIDGVSTDRTLDVVERFRRDRLRVVSEPDCGLYDAMNKGAALAQGDIVGFLNSDDFFCRTDALSLIAGAADENPNAAAVSAGLIFIDPVRTDRVRRTYGSTWFRRWMLRFGHMPPHPGFYVRAEAFKTVGPFDINRRVGGDFEWMLRFFYIHKLTAARVPHPIVAMRMGGVSTKGWESMRIINTEAWQALGRHKIRSATALIWAKYLVKAGQLLPAGASARVPDSVRWMPDRAEVLPARARN